MQIRNHSPFPKTIPFHLFQRHFEEINRGYWANVPAANKIEALAMQQRSIDPNPLNYFLVQDKYDKHVERDYSNWRNQFREFQNQIRLNVLMQVSSCFEVFLRTAVSLAFESRPGTILGNNNIIDGVQLLKSQDEYGNYRKSSYIFGQNVTEICKGEWKNRYRAFVKYFGDCPKLERQLDELDEIRKTRNNIAHYFGRSNDIYETPVMFIPAPITRVQHARLLEYLGIIFESAKVVDSFLGDNYIGSYDIIKAYFYHLQKGKIAGTSIVEKAYSLRKIIGGESEVAVGKQYYIELIKYYDSI